MAKENPAGQSLAQKIKATYDEHMGPLTAQREELEEQLAAINEQIAAADRDFIGALRSMGIASPASAKPKTAKSGGKATPASTKPKISDSEAVEHLKQLAADNPNITPAELVELGKDGMAAKGFESRGLKQRLTKLVSESNAISLKGGGTAA